MTDFKFTALYRTGDRITLCPDKSFDDIPREDLEGMEVGIGEKTILFTLHLDPEQKLIYRARRIKSARVVEIEPTVYLVGWRQSVGSRVIQSITYIVDYPQGGFTIHQAGKFNENHPWFYSPVLHQHEVFEGEKYKVDGIWRTK